MHVITTRNVHKVLPQALSEIFAYGEWRSNRNEAELGKTLVFPTPVCTVYEQPQERVMFWPERDANPFLHLIESIWMLAGRNDVMFMRSMAEQFASYSDDGATLHGAYGHRWRRHFGGDQIEVAIKRLQDDPDSRRCVIGMWDPAVDCAGEGKDLPCNTTIYLAVNNQGRLDMTVCCRSNDIIWGAYGANAVHFSILQELIALALGREMGRLYQISNNWHAYAKTVMPLRMADDSWLNQYSPYDEFIPADRVSTFQLYHGGMGWSTFLRDCELLIEDPAANGFSFPFFTRIAKPMLLAYRTWQDKRHDIGWRALAAKEVLAQMPERVDWRVAAEQWIERRVRRKMEGKGA